GKRCDLFRRIEDEVLGGGAAEQCCDESARQVSFAFADEAGLPHQRAGGGGFVADAKSVGIHHGVVSTDHQEIMNSPICKSWPRGNFLSRPRFQRALRTARLNGSAAQQRGRTMNRPEKPGAPVTAGPNATRPAPTALDLTEAPLDAEANAYFAKCVE